MCIYLRSSCAFGSVKEQLLLVLALLVTGAYLDSLGKLHRLIEIVEYGVILPHKDITKNPLWSRPGE
jgi:hypothetical protein